MQAEKALAKEIFSRNNPGMNAKMGRPPKEPEERRTKMVSVPLTEAEREEIDTAVEARGVKLAAWARDVLLRAARRQR